MLQRFTAGGEPDETFGDGSYAGVEGELCCIRNTRITVQPDHKVLMAANHEDWDRGGPYDRLLLRRYLENGEVDTSFADGGDQLFQGAESFQGPYEWGPPVLQSDGKILLPVGWQNNEGGRAITLDGPDGQSVAITRFNNDSLAPAVDVKEEQKPAVTPPRPRRPPPRRSTGSAPARAVAPRRCLSRRSLTLRLRTGRRKSEQSSIRSASVTVNGKKVKSTRRGASVNLRNLPKGRYTVVNHGCGWPTAARVRDVAAATGRVR